MNTHYFVKLFFVFVLSLSSCGELVAQQKAKVEKPNILFCVADDASYSHMSAYDFGFKWVETPAFDRVAKEGLLFLNAYTPNAKCAPSRASILTGKNPWQLEAAGNHNPFFPAKFITFMEALERNGYSVGYTGKGWAPGIPGKVKDEPRTLTGKEFNDIKTEAPTQATSSIDYTANFNEFLTSKPKNKPFTFWYGGFEPHRSYEYGSGVEKGEKKITDIDSVPPYWPDNEMVRNDMLDYAHELEYFDHHLGKMLKLLEERGELENTLIIVTSDNGMPFPRVKGHVYESAHHLPLAVMWKGEITEPGRQIMDYISFIDFAPTFLEVVGINDAMAGMQPIEGKSFLDILKSKSGKLIDRKRDHVLIGRERQDVGRPNDLGYPVRGIVKGNFIYTRNFEPERWPSGNPETGYMDTDGSPTKTAILEKFREGKDSIYWHVAFGIKPAEELYRLDTDRYAMVNLADEPEYAEVKRVLALQLAERLKSQGDPRMFGKGSVFDAYPYSNSSVRNFYERFKKGEKMKTGWINNSDFEQKGIINFANKKIKK